MQLSLMSKQASKWASYDQICNASVAKLPSDPHHAQHESHRPALWPTCWAKGTSNCAQCNTHDLGPQHGSQHDQDSTHTMGICSHQLSIYHLSNNNSHATSGGAGAEALVLLAGAGLNWSLSTSSAILPSVMAAPSTNNLPGVAQEHARWSTEKSGTFSSNSLTCHQLCRPQSLLALRHFLKRWTSSIESFLALIAMLRVFEIDLVNEQRVRLQETPGRNLPTLPTPENKKPKCRPEGARKTTQWFCVCSSEVWFLQPWPNTLVQETKPVVRMRCCPLLLLLPDVAAAISSEGLAKLSLESLGLRLGSASLLRALAWLSSLLRALAWELLITDNGHQERSFEWWPGHGETRHGNKTVVCVLGQGKKQHVKNSCRVLVKAS